MDALDSAEAAPAAGDVGTLEALLRSLVPGFEVAPGEGADALRARLRGLFGDAPLAALAGFLAPEEEGAPDPEAPHDLDVD